MNSAKIKSYILSRAKLLCSLCHEISCKWKKVLCKIVTKSLVVTKFDVTKSRLHCTFLQNCPNGFCHRFWSPRFHRTSFAVTHPLHHSCVLTPAFLPNILQLELVIRIRRLAWNIIIDILMNDECVLSIKKYECSLSFVRKYINGF